MVTIRNASVLMVSSLGMLLAVGCAGRHQAIPPSARLVAENQGKIDFVAPSDGQVFVEDRTANKLLYSGQIREGQHVNVEPIKNRIDIDGQMVRDQKIRDLDNLRVFFKGEPRADVAGSRTIVQPVQVVQPSQPQPSQSQTIRGSGDSEITVQPRGTNDAEIRVRPGANADSKVTVEPGQDGSKVTIERDRK